MVYIFSLEKSQFLHRSCAVVDLHVKNDDCLLSIANFEVMSHHRELVRESSKSGGV